MVSSHLVVQVVLVTVSTELPRQLTWLAFCWGLRSQSWLGPASRWRFKHSPRAARSCRSCGGRRGRQGRSGTAGTPASAAVSGRGCSVLASCWREIPKSCVIVTFRKTKGISQNSERPFSLFRLFYWATWHTEVKISSCDRKIFHNTFVIHFYIKKVWKSREPFNSNINILVIKKKVHTHKTILVLFKLNVWKSKAVIVKIDGPQFEDNEGTRQWVMKSYLKSFNIFHFVDPVQ